MANENSQSQLCLDQGQHAFVQDATKGTVSVFAGPYSFSLSANDRPVVYNREKGAFVAVNISEALKQNPLISEGDYLVLENPALDNEGKLHKPSPETTAPPLC